MIVLVDNCYTIYFDMGKKGTPCKYISIVQDMNENTRTNFETCDRGNRKFSQSQLSI